MWYIFTVERENLTVVRVLNSVDEIEKRDREYDLCCSTVPHIAEQEVDAEQIAMLRPGR